MPFLRRDEIYPPARQQGDQAYRKRLRDLLADPSLPAARRRAIRAALSAVGKPKTYSKGSAPKPGAIDNQVTFQSSTH